MRGHDCILIATIGTKPQVITTAVDLLLADGYHLGEVVVIHHAAAASPVLAGLERLRSEFADFPLYKNIEFKLSPMAGADGPSTDIESQADAEAAFRSLYRLLLAAKRSDPERPIHLSITGGRKVLAVYGMAAAQLLFDDEDRLWYVLARGRFLHEEHLHPEPDDEARLVRVPVLRWGTISPILTDLSQVDDPFAAVERQREHQVREALEEARAFVLGSLTGAERRVVALLVQEGLSDTQMAERLSLSARTVERHLGEAYAKAAQHWGLPNADRTQLVVLLNLYYRLAVSGIGGNHA